MREALGLDLGGPWKGTTDPLVFIPTRSPWAVYGDSCLLFWQGLCVRL